MADETPNGQEPKGNEGGQAPPGQDVEKFDEAYVRTLRTENAKWRLEAQAAKAKVTEYEQAQLSEAQKLQAQAQAAQAATQAAQAQLRQARAEAAVAKAAAKEGINPTLLGKLVEVQFNDDGLPVNVEAALKAVLTEYPQLKPQPGNVNATNPGRAPKLTVEDIKQMTPEQINARWDDVKAAMQAA